MKKLQVSLELIEIMDEIEQRGSFAKAAEHLNKVPSALSYAIQRMEEQLGVTLYERHGRRSVLTAAGKHLLTEGKILLEASARLADQTRELALGWEPRLRICLEAVVNFCEVWPVIQQFQQQFPQMELDITEEALGGTWERLVDDQADLLIGAAHPVPLQSGIATLDWKSIEMVFAVARHHPLANLDGPISRDQLSDHTWVVVHDTSRYSAPRDTGRILSDKRFYVRTLEQKIQVQLSGVGIGFLPRHRIETYLENGELKLCQLADSESVESEILLAWKRVNHGKGLKTLINMLLEH